MKKVYYNKLVRDNIPNVIRAKGSDCKIRVLDNKDYKKALLKKLGEEASGVINAKGKKELTRELADAIDVIEAIKKSEEISEADIKRFRKLALEKKGGFSKKLYLVWSSDDGYKTNEKS